MENMKFYLMAVIVMTGLMTAFMSFLTVINSRQIAPEDQRQIFIFFLFAFATIFSSTLYSTYGGKTKAIIALTLPASHLEKFLVGFVYAFVIFPVIYVICFYVADVLALSLIKGEGDLLDFKLLKVVEDDILQVFPVLTSIGLLGAIHFQKIQFIKTAFAVVIAFVTMLIFNEISLSAMVPSEIKQQFFFSTLTIKQADKIFEITLNSQVSALFDYLLTALSLPILTATYLKIKEKEG